MEAGVGNQGNEKQGQQDEGEAEIEMAADAAVAARPGELFFDVFEGEEADVFLAPGGDDADGQEDDPGDKERSQHEINEKTEIGVVDNGLDIENNGNGEYRADKDEQDGADDRESAAADAVDDAFHASGWESWHAGSPLASDAGNSKAGAVMRCRQDVSCFRQQRRATGGARRCQSGWDGVTEGHDRWVLHDACKSSYRPVIARNQP